MQKEPRTVDSNPFHDIDILREHHDGLEVALHQRALDKWAAKV